MWRSELSLCHGLGLFSAVLVATAIPGSVPGMGGQTPPAVTTWLPLHLGTVLSTWGVPLHTKGL